MQEFSKGHIGIDVGKLQEMLLKAGFEQPITSEFEDITLQNVLLFQKRNKLPETGVVDESLMFRLVKLVKGMKESDFIAVAKDLQCEVPALKAVHKVESGRFGFNSDGRPKILFEGHVFWRELAKLNLNPAQFVKGNENILYREQTTKFTRKNNEEEYELRLEKAMLIHPEAALKSASYGAFQILGSNFEPCGFKNVFEFYDAMQISEGKHLEILGVFLKANKWLSFLQKKDWKGFAQRYNGANYTKFEYDVKLETAYNEFKAKK